MKKELKQLIQLAWPLLIAQLTQTLMGVSDTVMAGHYSATDMAAVAVGFSITVPVMLFIQGIILALPPIISRFNGAGEFDRVANTTQQTAWLGLCVSLLLLIPGLFAPKWLALMPIQVEFREITAQYIVYVAASMPFFALYLVLRNYCEGLSVTKPSMQIMAIGLLINLPVNYVLIYGKFGLPAMGGAGCGLATALVFVGMFIATLLYLLRSKKFAQYQLFKQFYRPHIAEIGNIAKLGLPIAMTILFEASLFAVVALLLAPFGVNVVAAHQIALNFSSLMFMFPMSIGMAVSIRVGHLLGEKQPKNAIKAITSALIFGLIIASFTATLTIVARTEIGRIYSSDMQIVQMAAGLMFLAALFQFSDAIQVISANALRGYKDTTAMFLITFVSYWLVGMPIGCILGLTDWVVPQMAASGFWIGFICGLTTAALLLGYRVKYIQNKSLLLHC